jgi:hypothetical protein
MFQVRKNLLNGFHRHWYCLSTVYTKAIQLTFIEGHYTVRKYMVGQWPIYTAAEEKYFASAGDRTPVVSAVKTLYLLRYPAPNK